MRSPGVADVCWSFCRIVSSSSPVKLRVVAAGGVLFGFVQCLLLPIGLSVQAIRAPERIPHVLPPDRDIYKAVHWSSVATANIHIHTKFVSVQTCKLFCVAVWTSSTSLATCSSLRLTRRDRTATFATSKDKALPGSEKLSPTLASAQTITVMVPLVSAQHPSPS